MVGGSNDKVGTSELDHPVTHRLESVLNSRGELRRIRAVYCHYDIDPKARSRWNPDNPGARAIGAELENGIRDLARASHFPKAGKICEVGCGTGGMLRMLGEALTEEQPYLYGLDILASRIEAARRAIPSAKLWTCSAESIPLPDRSVHLLVVATVFSSILQSDLAHGVAAEMWRVMSDGGSIIGYDVRYPNLMNPHTRRLGLNDWRSLFPAASIQVRSITLIPQLARRLGRLTHIVYPSLAAIPILRTHYLILISRATPARPGDSKARSLIA